MSQSVKGPISSYSSCAADCEAHGSDSERVTSIADFTASRRLLMSARDLYNNGKSKIVLIPDMLISPNVNHAVQDP
jgi:hypothetical protein